MKKKVLIMSSAHQWNDSRVFLKEAKSLNKYYDVSLVAVAEFEYKEIEGIKIYGIKHRGRTKRYKTWIELYKLAKKIQPDICHFQDPELIPVSKFIKSAVGCKLIYDVHEDYPVSIMNREWIPKSMRNIISRAFNNYEKKSTKFIDAVITVAEKVDKDFPENINKTIVKNYPNFKVDEEKIMKKINTMELNEVNIVYVGSITKIRGILEIIEAVNLVDGKLNVKLQLAGKFESEELYNSAMSLDKKGRVNYLGLIEVNEVQELLLKSHIGLCCLHPVGQYPYSLPIKIFEYMASGLAVVYSNFEFWDTLIGEGGGIKVNPLDPKEICNAIEKLIESPDTVREMSKYNFNRYKENFTWQEEEKKLIQLYRGLEEK